MNYDCLLYFCSCSGLIDFSICLESNCWQEWLIFSDVFFFLMKSGCIDFVDFVDKLVSRLIEDDHSILRTNHVTWLLAQIIRVELVMNALNNDSRKVCPLFIASSPPYHPLLKAVKPAVEFWTI